MNSEANFKQIEHEESNAVVSFNNGTTFKVGQLMKQLNAFFVQSVLYKLSERLSQTGLGKPPNCQENWNKSIDAEILEPQSGEWKKGKLRMRVILEFCPDEPEVIENNANQQSSNSLDDIRQTIT